MSKLNPDDAYLSYHDVRLTREDVDTLKNDWLTDNTPDPLTLKDALPDFTKTTHVFLPVNDCRNVEMAEGGSHWSLLLVSTADGVAFHYDSLSPSNKEEARIATQKISKLMNKPLKMLDLDSPQQENSSDCGVFVCLQMKHLLLKRLLQASGHQKVKMALTDRNIDANGGRKEMLKIIEGFRREGERRRSRSTSPFGRHDSSKSPPRIE
ncbi:MAG: hypothetical protein M1833_006384 [Piccolia ochrophora]|nr:MAG: hypothetical protein M1833_006384 [Piccolia ochrophora]